MKFYIKLENGQPIHHPHVEENMISAYPTVDLENLPSNWAKFERVEQPEVGFYEVAVCTYEWVGNVVKDVWTARPMTTEERAAKDAEVGPWVAKCISEAKTYGEEKLAAAVAEGRETHATMWTEWLASVDAIDANDYVNFAIPVSPDHIPTFGADAII